MPNSSCLDPRGKFLSHAAAALMLAWLGCAAAAAGETNFLAPIRHAAWGLAEPGDPARVSTGAEAAAIGRSLHHIAGEMLSSTPAPLPAVRGISDVSRQRAIARLRDRAGADFRIAFRPGNQTVMQIRGRALEPVDARIAPSIQGGSEQRTARAFLQANRDLLLLDDPSQELHLEGLEHDAAGGHRLRYSQVYQGLPVWPAGVNVHLDEQGSVTLMNGAYVPTPRSVATIPFVTEAAAVERARASVPNGSKGGAGEPTLIIYAPLSQSPRLAWRVKLVVDFAHVWMVVVDGRDGRVLNRQNSCMDARVTGSGVDLAGQNRSFSVWSTGSSFIMADTTKPMFNAAFDPVKDPRGVISIYDAREVKQQELKTVYLVESGTPNAWIPDAVSALVNFDETFDYYLERHRRSSLDGNGGNIQAVVRVAQLDNAFWNGDAKMMFFGSVRPYPLALDVVGHELTHGVTQNSADLIYELQPGAMNEAFSDIFGEMVEARTKGRPDWLLGTELGKTFRDFKNPGTITYGGRPLPAKMSEYIDLPNDANSDHGGVHLNSSIINHAFYLLAEGLPGAIGMADAEKIFYRCLAAHLQKQSQFIDARLGCIASADELFGAGSAQARKTAEAFDVVEIFEKPSTPEPSPIPVVEGPDATIFVGFDPSFGAMALGRQEAAKGDPADGVALVENVQPAKRPAVSGDGSFVLFVDDAHDLCGVDTDNPRSLECTGNAGLVHSVAVSPDARLYAFVLRDPVTTQPQNQINVYDSVADTTRSFKLVAPVADSTPVDSVLYADSMVFTPDGKQLIYDALTELRFGGGTAVQRWSIFRLDLATESTTTLVPPLEGADFGNPTLGRAGNRYLAFDARSVATGDSSIIVADLFTGNAGIVGTVSNGLGYPCFTGDESAIVYAVRDLNATFTGFSLVRQPLTADRLGVDGQASLWLADSPLGVTYRRGAFVSSNALPVVALTAPTDGATFAATASVSIAADAADSDGSVARVEFYQGATKLGERTTAPFTFTWPNVAAGEYRVAARAIDNLGGASDSAPVRVSVGGEAPVSLSAALTENWTLQVTVRGPAGSYMLQHSSNLVQWIDATPVTLDASGTVSLTPTPAPAGREARFYRVRSN